MDDCPRDGIALDAIFLAPREDLAAVAGDLDVPRIDTLRPLEAVRIHAASEGAEYLRVGGHVGPEVLEGEGLEPDFLAGCLSPEGCDPLQGPRVFLILDSQHPEDLKAVLRRVPVVVVVEETVDRARLGRYLLDARDPSLQFVLRVAVIVPRVRPVAVPAEVRDRGGHVQVRRQERLPRARGGGPPAAGAGPPP